jgi:hypothetical protein
MKQLINGKSHNSFFVQRTKVDKTYLTGNRINFFKPYIEGKKVLHIGFVDWPITDVNSSLHVSMAPFCERLDGFDVNFEHAEKLRVPNGDLYNNWDLLPDDYDTILIPEVIEHVGNVEEFLKKINLKKGTLIITAPDSYLLKSEWEETDQYFLEAVHPDHNCYYTPFTLKNIIEKYTDRKVNSLHWINKRSIAAICKLD